jgi:hypothetical protein
MAEVIVPMTLEQEWFFARRITDGGIRMAITRAFDIDGLLEIERFLAAFRAVFSRHQGMRTAIRIDQRGEPCQVISPPSADIPLICQSVACRSRAQFEAYARSAVRADRMCRWSPVRDPLYLVRLLRRSEKEHILLATFDHLAFDDRAVELFFHYLWGEYSGEHGMAVGVHEADVAGDLAACVRAERHRYSCRGADINPEYWARRYALAPTTWVADKHGAQQAGSRYESYQTNLHFDAGSSARVRSRAAEVGASMLVASLSVFAWMAFQLTAHRRVTIYVPFDDRGSADRGVIGNFACVRPIIVDRANGPAATYLDQVAGQVFRALAYRHMDGKSERRCELLQLAAAHASDSYRALSVNYLRADGVEVPVAPAPGLSVRRVSYSQSLPSPGGAALGLVVRDSPEMIRLGLKYTKELFSPERARLALSSCAAQLMAFGPRVDHLVVDQR